MKPRIVALFAALVVAACSDDAPVAPLFPDAAPEENVVVFGTVIVSNSNDAGNGSFRRAVEQANSNPSIRRVVFLSRVGVTRLRSSVTFTGAQHLTVDGNRATIDGSLLLGAAEPAFVANGGGDITLNSLTFRNAPGEGVSVEVPPDAEGTQRVALVGVDVIGNKGHGVLVNDQVDPSTTDGVQPADGGSPASLDVIVIASRFIGNGFSVSDRDGLRVNEGGDGDLRVSISLTRAEGNGADGVELDERGAGDVRFLMIGSQLVNNGVFDPLDLDDGFDIDEYNDGSLIGNVVLSSSSNNFEEGFDFNENNAGDFRVDMTAVEASGNNEEGIDFEEDDDFAGGGDLVTTLVGIKANGNKAGDAGVKVREKGVGNAVAALKQVEASQNLVAGIHLRETEDGDISATVENATTVGNTLNGIEVRDGQVGNLTASIANSTSTGNGGNGIHFDEGSAGSLVGTVSNSTSSGNTGSGINAVEASDGTATVTLMNVNFGAGNTGGNTTGNATFIGS